MVKMKEQIKTPEKELSDKEPTYLMQSWKHWSSGCSHKWLSVVAKKEEKVKAMQSEIMENIGGTKSEREETGTQINDLEQKE